MKNLVTYCCLLFFTANSLLAYHLPVQNTDTLKPENEQVAFSVSLLQSKTKHQLHVNPSTIVEDEVFYTDNRITVNKIHPNPSSIMAQLDRKSVV